MADFETALEITLAFEGGNVRNPADPGGQTNLGITMEVFAATAKRLLGIAPTPENLDGLTRAQAAVIYRANYWNPIHGDYLQVQELANIVFDFYVTSEAHSTRLLQTVLNALGAMPQLTVDGVLGASTMNALATLRQADVYSEFRIGRIAFYQSLGAKFPMFVEGWVRRARSFPDLTSLDQFRPVPSFHSINSVASAQWKCG